MKSAGGSQRFFGRLTRHESRDGTAHEAIALRALAQPPALRGNKEETSHQRQAVPPQSLSLRHRPAGIVSVLAAIRYDELRENRLTPLGQPKVTAIFPPELYTLLAKENAVLYPLPYLISSPPHRHCN